ncbi:MAG: polysaccharide biosynthesis tyrosine autokinase [Clostridia bacterium]|nr:polysaccharide biosynthesis tyrosine autokinase [Clostridia bacterium]
MQFKDYLRIIKKWIRVILFITILSIAASAILSFFILDKIYTASTTIIINRNDENISLGNVITDQKELNTYINVIKSDRVLIDVMRQLNFEIPIEKMRKRVSVNPEGETGLIRIKAESVSPKMASSIANTTAQVFKEHANRIIYTDNIKIVDKARIPEIYDRPNPFLNILIACAAGVMFGTLISFVYEHLDNSVEDPYALQSRFNIPLIGIVPDYYLKGKIYRINPLSFMMKNNLPPKKMLTDAAATEAFKIIRTNILSLSSAGNNKVFVVTSPEKLEGKSTIAVNLAIVMAQIGKKVLLMDCNFRKPELCSVFNIASKRGITDILNEAVEYRGLYNIVDVPNLHVMPSGTKTFYPSELLLSDKMANLMEKVKADYDAVLIDTPPAVLFTDAAILSKKADAVIMVVRHRNTNIDLFKRALHHLKAVNSNIVGVVVNALSVEYYDTYDFYN